MEVASQLLSTFRRRIGLICVLTCVALVLLNACAGGKPPLPSSARAPEPPAPGAPAPGAPAAPAPAPEAPTSPVHPPAISPGFEEIEQARSQLVEANAYWRRPNALNVEENQQIGLGIQSAPLTSQINEQLNQLPGTTQPAGPIKVSPYASARLEADPSYAEVTPSGSQNQSTPSEIQLSFMWTVRPKKPTSDLVLTAYVEVQLEGTENRVVTTPITLHIPVHRTVSYTFRQVFTNWATLSGIAVTLAGGAGWILTRTKRKKQSSEA